MSGCANCHSNRVYRDGMRYTARGAVQAYQCRNCGKKWQALDGFRPEKVGYLDIEASGLKSDFGYIISWAVKTKGGSVHSHVMRDRSLAEEKTLIKHLLATMRSYDRLVTYYGTRFDLPFIMARAVYHALDPLKYGEVAHTDLYFVVRHKLATLSSKRLANVTRFFGVKGKTPLDPDVWVAASFGDKKAMRYILKHNIADVKILEKLDERLEPYYKLVNRSA
jgi:uncharacterized protein YprB with RNaseH-like and TPR domain